MLRSYAVTQLRSYAVTQLRSYAVTQLRSYAVTQLRSYAVTQLRSYYKVASSIYLPFIQVKPLCMRTYFLLSVIIIYRKNGNILI